jgi:hypothetical protein
MIELSSLKPHPYNPRTITKRSLAKLKKSIKEFLKMMEVNKIVYDEDNIILSGNMRREALLSLGYKEIPKTWTQQVLGWTKEEKEEYMIKDNAHYGEFDFDLLTSYFDNYDLVEFGVNGAYDVPEDPKQEEQDNTKSIKSTCPTCGQDIDKDTPF